ncbi:MAG: hypothetical protein IJV14_06625 [Lachnospiraceae bacterium]|nr:hypothetical protein [Lachnospiraceae bacterium]
MSYTIRRWMSSGDILFDDSAKAKTADEAIQEAKRLAGICRSIINDDIKQKIKEMKEGEKIIIKRRALKFTMHIKRLKR